MSHEQSPENIKAFNKLPSLTSIQLLNHENSMITTKQTNFVLVLFVFECANNGPKNKRPIKKINGKTKERTKHNRIVSSIGETNATSSSMIHSKNAFSSNILLQLSDRCFDIEMAVRIISFFCAVKSLQNNKKGHSNSEPSQDITVTIS